MSYTSKQNCIYAGVEAVVYKYADCDSTNDEAMQLLTENVMPVVVKSEHQRKGRGRRTKSWVGEAGTNVYLSIALSKPMWSAHFSDYQLLTACAALDAVSSFAGPSVFRLKYPNDVVHSDGTNVRKVSGVLVETEFRGGDLLCCVCGVGINVNQTAFNSDDAPHATSLKLVLGKDLSVHSVAECVSENFFRLLEVPADEVFERWVEELDIIDKSIRIRSQNESYRVLRVQRDGMLSVQHEQSGVKEVLGVGLSFRIEDYV